MMEHFTAVVGSLMRLPVGSPCPDCGELWSERPNYPSGVRRIRVACPHELSARELRDLADVRNAQYTRWMGHNASKVPLRDPSLRLSNVIPTTAIDAPLKAAHQYLDGIDEAIKHGMGLYLHGPSGTGKTFLATALASELDSRKITTCLLTSGQAIDGYKSRDPESFRSMAQSVEVLIIDDLGSEGVTDFAASKLFEAINDRYASKKPLIITSNYSPTALCSRYSRLLQGKGLTQDDASMSVRRILSRIAERCDSVEFQGEDYRLSSRSRAASAAKEV